MSQKNKSRSKNFLIQFHYYANIYLIFFERKLFQITSTIILISIFHFYFFINMPFRITPLCLCVVINVCYPPWYRMQISLDGLSLYMEHMCCFSICLYHKITPKIILLLIACGKLQIQKKMRDVVIQQNRLAGGPLVFIIIIFLLWILLYLSLKNIFVSYHAAPAIKTYQKRE